LVEKKHLIVGIDPGTTTGIALVDLKGEVVGVDSSRTWSFKDFIHLIIGKGYPLIVATDVSPIPAFVDKVRHLFEAVPFEPPHSLTVEEKRELCRSAGLPDDFKFHNSHERDALAAAIKALDSYGEKFRWIDRKLDERGLSNLSERIKTLVVTGSSLSDSLEQVLSEKKPTARAGGKPTKAPEDRPKLARNRRIESSMIANMESEILDLKTSLKEREMKIKSLGIELEKIQSDGFWEILRSNEVDSRNRMIVELKRSLSRVAADRDRLREKLETTPEIKIDVIGDRVEILDIIDDLSKRKAGDLRKTSRILMVRDCSGTGSTVAHRLREAGIEGILYGGKIPAPAKEGIEACGIAPVQIKKLTVLDLGDIAIVERKSLERALSRERKRMSKQVRRGATVRLERYVEDYRSQVTSQR
jgi:predicted RNase H-like nuclease (RuvC/YqgF family)